MNECDKCGEKVPRSNDASWFDAIMTGNSSCILFLQPRHLMPVIKNGVIVCEGSPSRAQLLPGIPRDTRGYTLDETRVQAAIAAWDQMQSEAHDDVHIHDEGNCCECGSPDHCCCECPRFQ